MNPSETQKNQILIENEFSEKQETMGGDLIDDPNLTAFKDFPTYLSGLKNEDLYDVESKIDPITFPDRYELVRSEIIKRESANNEQDWKIKGILEYRLAIKGYFLFLFITGFFQIICGGVSNPNAEPFDEKLVREQLENQYRLDSVEQLNGKSDSLFPTALCKAMYQTIHQLYSIQSCFPDSDYVKFIDQNADLKGVLEPFEKRIKGFVCFSLKQIKDVLIPQGQKSLIQNLETALESYAKQLPEIDVNYCDENKERLLENLKSLSDNPNTPELLKKASQAHLISLYVKFNFTFDPQNNFYPKTLERKSRVVQEDGINQLEEPEINKFQDKDRVIYTSISELERQTEEKLTSLTEDEKNIWSQILDLIKKDPRNIYDRSSPGRDRVLVVNDIASMIKNNIAKQLDTQLEEKKRQTEGFGGMIGLLDRSKLVSMQGYTQAEADSALQKQKILKSIISTSGILAYILGLMFLALIAAGGSTLKLWVKIILIVIPPLLAVNGVFMLKQNPPMAIVMLLTVVTILLFWLFYGIHKLFRFRRLSAWIAYACAFPMVIIALSYSYKIVFDIQYKIAGTSSFIWAVLMIVFGLAFAIMITNKRLWSYLSEKGALKLAGDHMEWKINNAKKQQLKLEKQALKKRNKKEVQKTKI